MPKISSKNQVTLPVGALTAAGLKAGDQVSIEVSGDEIVIRRETMSFDDAIGIFHGLYEPGYLDKLRSGERW